MLATIGIETGDVDAGLSRLRGVLALDPTSRARPQRSHSYPRAVGTIRRGRCRAGELRQAHRELTLPRHVRCAHQSLAWGRSRSTEHLRRFVANHPARAHLSRGRRYTRHPTRDDGVVCSRDRRDARRLSIPAPLVPVPGRTPRLRRRSREYLRMLERAVDARLYDLLWLNRCPAIACVRDADAFAALRSRVALNAEAIRDALHVAHPVR